MAMDVLLCSIFIAPISISRWIVGPSTGVSLLLRLDLESGEYDGWLNLENCLVQNELARRSPLGGGENHTNVITLLLEKRFTNHHMPLHLVSKGPPSHRLGYYPCDCLQSAWECTHSVVGCE